MAEFNGVKNYNKKFLFDNEVESEERIEELIGERIEELKEEKQIEMQNNAEEESIVMIEKDLNLTELGLNKSAEQILQTLVINEELSDQHHFLNLVKMTLMWTQASFN